MKKRSRKKTGINDNTFLWVGIIIGVIIISALLYNVSSHLVLKSKQQYAYYNNFPFAKNNGVWVTQIELNDTPYQVFFYYHPLDLKNIEIEKGVEKKILRLTPKDKIYITLKPGQPSKLVIGAIEIAKITGERYHILNIPTQSALTDNTNNPNVPAITCKDSNSHNIVIWVTTGDYNKVYSEGDCVIVEGTTLDNVIKSADRLSYALLGIMPS